MHHGIGESSPSKSSYFDHACDVCNGTNRDRYVCLIAKMFDQNKLFWWLHAYAEEILVHNGRSWGLCFKWSKKINVSKYLSYAICNISIEIYLFVNLMIAVFSQAIVAIGKRLDLSIWLDSRKLFYHRHYKRNLNLVYQE